VVSRIGFKEACDVVAICDYFILSNILLTIRQIHYNDKQHQQANNQNDVPK